MEIIIIRHGMAEDREEFAKTGQPDHLRPLVLKGRKKSLKSALKLKEVVKTADVIVSSPYLRAKQTSEIVKEVFGNIPVIEVPELVPHSTASAFLKWLKMRGRTFQRVIVVGHEPHLSSFASWLLSGQHESFLELKKGGICLLSFESFEDLKPGVVKLGFLIPPKLID